MPIQTIIFDFGGVLIDWNPRYLYRQIFEDEERMEYFLSQVCSPYWNEEQDGGRSLVEATTLLVEKYPEWEKEIRAFYGRWEEMLGGAIEGTVEILRKLHAGGNYRLVGLTNWSAETFPVALERFDFLQLFEGILVSGVEKLKKPDPKIYELLLNRYNIDGATAIFIDDNLRNVKAARASGIPSIHFQSVAQLEGELTAINVHF